MPNGRYADVIERLQPGAAEAGDIVHIDGRVLGRHDGIIHYTIGQRRGIGVALGEPLYVVHLDPAGRRVIVGPRDALATRRLHLRDVNWLGDMALAESARRGRDIHARVRSTRPPLPARLVRDDGHVLRRPRRKRSRRRARSGLRLLRQRRAGARVLGGGWIERAENAREAEHALRRLVGQKPLPLAV